LQPLSLALATALALVTSSAHAQAPLSTFKDCDNCPEMVALPPGKFLMGASKEDRKFADAYTIQGELPQHEVTIGYSFAIGRHEVTVAEFAAYVAETGAKTGGECDIRVAEFGPNRGKFIGTPKPGAENYPGLVTITDGNFRTPGGTVSDQQPATCISHREALGYLDWLSKKSGKAYRLPTEAEWEYAARAGSTTPFYFGGGLKDLCKYGNFADSKSVYNARIVAKCAENPSPEGTAAVGSYLPNAWGLQDMIGNGFELTEDCASDNYEGAPNDGSPRRESGGACETFATRSFFFDSIGTSLRSAARCLVVDWDSRSNGLTFRIAVSLDDNAWDRK
jgi:formylglycine-generating enzyme required for sulfatase activity